MNNSKFEKKEKEGFKICSKCYEELKWINGYCPKCNSQYFLPYRDIRGKEFKND